MKFSVPVPFADHLGFELCAFADGVSEVQFPPDPERLNSFSVIHGGVSTAQLDVTMAAAATQSSAGGVASPHVISAD